jgi:hypothetical protein
MVSCQEPSPLKGANTLSSVTPMTHALSFVSMGVEARCRPSKSTAHCRHMEMQPFLCNGCPRHGRHHCPSPSLLSLAIAIAVAVNHRHRHPCCVAVSHCCHRCPCRWPLPSCHRRPSQLLSPSAITVAMPFAISESCCLGAARIVFNQLKQRMLTLFYFVHTVDGALIEAG